MSGDTKEKTLIIGAGEVGKSLANVLSPFYQVKLKDLFNEVDGEFRVIHLCFPYNGEFINQAKQCINQYKPELVINHSTVKVGTTRQLGNAAVHSPVNGRHPNLESGIKTFVKFIGGTSEFSVSKAQEFLNKAGIKTKIFSGPETTELAKILCTTHYGWDIVFMKEVARICKEYNLPFDEVYTEWTKAYNNGYQELKEPQFTRPILKFMEGKIGGHCVVPNCDLLDDGVLTKTIKERNLGY